MTALTVSGACPNRTKWSHVTYTTTPCLQLPTWFVSSFHGNANCLNLSPETFITHSAVDDRATQRLTQNSWRWWTNWTWECKSNLSTGWIWVSFIIFCRSSETCVVTDCSYSRTFTCSFCITLSYQVTCRVLRCVRESVLWRFWMEKRIKLLHLM